MFYWIQTYLTKHFKWILFILLAVMIVSFVFTIGNFSPLGGSGGQRYKEQPFLSYDLSSAKDQQEIFGRGQTSLSLNYPSFFGPPSEAVVQDYSLSRVAFLHLADQIGLPKPTDDEFKEYVQSLTAFMNYSTQEFDQSRFTAFIDSLTASGLTEAYVTSIIEEDYRMNKVREMLQGPGHILPFEAIHGAQMQNTEWTLETGRMSYVEFNAEIVPSEEELLTYFHNNEFRYEIPTKNKAGYIVFDPRDYIDLDYQPEPGEKSIHFFTNKARYQAAIPTPEPIKKEDGTTETPEAPEVTLEEVEEQVISEIRLERAKKEAQKVAEEFAYNLFDKEIKNGGPAFEAALSKAGKELKELVPYPESAVIMQDGLTEETLRQVFRLNATRYYSDPIQNKEIFVILIYQGEIEPYTPELPEVRAQVVTDFTEEKKRALFIEQGKEIREAVSAAVNAGESFESAAKAQGLTHKGFESFTRAGAPPEGLNQNLLNQLDNLNEGDVSDWIATETDGNLVYAAKKVIPDYESDAEEVKAYLESQNLSGSNVELVMREFLTQALSQTVFGRDNS